MENESTYAHQIDEQIGKSIDKLTHKVGSIRFGQNKLNEARLGLITRNRLDMIRYIREAARLYLYLHLSVQTT